MDNTKNEIDIREELLSLDEPPAPITMLLGGGDDERMEKIAEHRLQLQSIRKQYPNPKRPYKIGVYIRYYNQTKHENYLDNHMAHFMDAIELCPNWTLVDFYIDEGQTAPNMENAPEWCRLIEDCFSGKVDLILTQKVSNVCKKDNTQMITFLAGILASQLHPVGMYFVSENVFTLATYYLEDMKSLEFFPEGHTHLCDGEPVRGLLDA